LRTVAALMRRATIHLDSLRRLQVLATERREAT
jgi:hypothetical protein